MVSSGGRREQTSRVAKETEGGTEATLKKKKKIYIIMDKPKYMLCIFFL